nr:ABC transporter permease [uncultured Lachnoclostridium sp.]
MMLYNISVKNIRKSYKDYTIYFMTLIFGVAIFYLFNSIESQQAMLKLSESTKEIVMLLVDLMSGVSVGVSVILGFLIVYANGFLIRQRKKEFGIYMTLGMSKRSISKILLGETLIIGAISLAIGLVVGIFASQFMSILLGKLFDADMEQFEFVYSKAATMKTIIYFGIMFLLVILFNVIAIGRFKLVDLLNANRKNQTVRVKNPIVSVITFVVSVVVLAYCYFCVTKGITKLSQGKSLVIIGLGSVSTYLFFWSLSGFFLTVLQKSKKIYYRGLNAFILRQIHNKINTMVFTMTIICLLLFVSISAISSGISLKDSMNQDIKEAAPADLCVYSDGTGKQFKGIEERLREIKFPMTALEEYVEIPCYTNKQLHMKDLLAAEDVEEIRDTYPLVKLDALVDVFALSDYNKIAKFYGDETYELKNNEYIAICTFQTFLNYQNKGLSSGKTLKIGNRTYQPRYKECKDGKVVMGSSYTTLNTIILPDSAFAAESGLTKTKAVFSANYKAKQKKELEKAEDEVRTKLEENEYKEKIRDISYVSRIYIKESCTGLAVIVTFVGLYIGIVFLITSAALLALKELSEAADNKERYLLLRKLGTEDSMVYRALFWQIAIFFFMPLLLAVIHSIFGIKFISAAIVQMTGESLLKPIIVSALIYGILYFIYFISTYVGSKRILEE